MSPTNVVPRATPAVALVGADAAAIRSVAMSEELVVLDEAPKPVVQLRGRLGTVRVASNELCLTPDQVQTIVAEGDHA